MNRIISRATAPALTLTGALGITLGGALLLAQPASAADCHPAYTGACIPITKDVDCSQIRDRNFRLKDVTRDPYDLDRDNDGIACESGTTPAHPGSGTPSGEPTLPVTDDVTSPLALAAAGSALVALGGLLVRGRRRRP